MAALASIAQNPERIKAMFEQYGINRAGIYVLKFYINGILTHVTVDDFIPVIKGTKKPAFAQNKDGKLWISLVEKAWAKLHGSYSRIVCGKPLFALAHLTGIPGSVVKHDKIEN